jgi:hypothetical protein
MTSTETSEKSTRVDDYVDNMLIDPSNPPVLWRVGKTHIDRDFVMFILIYLFIFIIATASVINLSTKKEGLELWSGLLSLTLGLVSPQPKLPQSKKMN